MSFNPQPSTLNYSRLQAAQALAERELLQARNAEGYWTGELSSSALSTATAVCALSIVRRQTGATSGEGASSLRQVLECGTPVPLSFAHEIADGLTWLAQHQNADGGWGDTTLSLSNLSTTVLCWSAFGSVPGADEQFASTVKKAEHWITHHAGSTAREKLAPAIITRYGKDRTFSVPILTMSALAGRLGSGKEAWQDVIPLPFELAACPPGLFAALRLPVVSYALPALIAIGQARHHHLPSRNPLVRWLRNAIRQRTLQVLEKIQPNNGGFLEATPLTSFVTMSLAGSGHADHPVCRKGVEFLLAAQRTDGSWPIDTNLATWVTTLSINALAGRAWEANERNALESWLHRQQYKQKHPYTQAAPGGWAWTDLPGGVPDADDTAGALLALSQLGEKGAEPSGLTWLLGLQNRDGGIPTFCKGWGNLPFDRSSADLTAHALRAWQAWRNDVPKEFAPVLARAMSSGLGFLRTAQKEDGSWVPLWFGNQHSPTEENPVYGTSRVLCALAEMENEAQPKGWTPNGVLPMLQKGVAWMLAAQKSDGGWGAFPEGPASIEETALALEALAACAGSVQSLSMNPVGTRSTASHYLAQSALSNDERVPFRGGEGQLRELEPRIRESIHRGADWLVQKVESGEWKQPAPIGFYFAKLWYYEKLYPAIFTVSALTRVVKLLS